MPTIADIRSQYPQYNDMSDGQLADALYQKFYSDLPREEFDRKVGVAPSEPAATGAARATPVGGMLSPVQTMLSGLENLVPTASQGTSPNIEAYGGRFLGEGTYGEAGEVFYKDPETGAPVETDQSKHIAIRDPRDGRVKVFARSTDTNEGPLVGVSRVLAPGLATGPVSTRPGLASLPRREAAIPTGEELRSSYLAAKESPEVAAVRVKPASAAGYAGDTALELNTEWLDKELAPKTFHILSKLSKSGPNELTFANIDSARRLLGRLAGKGDEEAAAAGIAKRKLDEWVGGIDDADVLAGDPRLAQGIMQEGRADYAGFKLDEALNKRLAAAELDAAAAHSGLNLQNRLYQKARDFLKSDDSRGLTTTQRAAIEEFVKGTAPAKVARYVGNLLGGGGGLGAVVTGGVGHAMVPGPGPLLPLGGLGLNRLGAALTARQAEKLAEMIRADTPLAKRMQGPIEDWNKAVKVAEMTPTARNLSRLTIASRNLSNNLKDAGVNVSPNDLLKSLYGQKPAGAEADSNE